MNQRFAHPSTLCLGFLLAVFLTACSVENVVIRPPQREGGETHIFGEVVNHSGAYARNLQVKGSLLSEDGTVLASPTFWGCSSIIKPYDAVPGGTYYSGQDKVSGYDLWVESTGMPPVPDASLVVAESKVSRDESGRIHLTGILANTGTERYEHIRMCASFYDSDGKLDGFLVRYAPDLGPGQRGSFDVFGSPFGGEPSENSVTYRLWVQPTGGTSYIDRGYVSTGETPF